MSRKCPAKSIHQNQLFVTLRLLFVFEFFLGNDQGYCLCLFKDYS